MSQTLSFVIEGLLQMLMGASVHELDIGIFAAAISLFFNHTRVGVWPRAIADDPQAALSDGIRLQKRWRIMWVVAGFVALVAGLLWGARQGVHFTLTLVILKALPVLIIGGFTSIADDGAIKSKPTTRSERIHSRLAHLPLAPKSRVTRNGAPVKDRAPPPHLERLAPRLIPPARLCAQISG